MKALATILVRPRETMRRILDRGRDRMVVPVLLLAICSGFLKDFDPQKAVRAAERVDGPVWLMVLGVLLAAVLGLLLLFYVVSWVAVLAGRVLEGKGEGWQVRSALAWGFAPVIWAILYRLPAVFIIERQDAKTARELAQILGDFNWGAFLVFAVLEAITLGWWLVTTSNTLAEAHRFSPWRGFATLMLTLAAPFVLMIAAVLTSQM